MCFCGQSKPSSKGRNAIEAYDKVDKDDKSTFRLNAAKGMPTDRETIDKMTKNIPKHTIKLGSAKADTANLTTGNLGELVKRKILKSEYQDLLQKYASKKENWIDPDFPHTDSSWGSNNKKIIWKRVEELIDQPRFVENNFSPSDILQGKLGNCYFLSAVAGLAEKPYRIKKLFPSFQINKNGIYMARILHRGIYQEVVVDDYFPCNQSGNLLGALPAGGEEIWVMILEKCWAKLFGSYEAIDGGLPNEVLRAFSAAPTYNFRMNYKKEDQDKLWEKIFQADKLDHIICCGTEVETKQNKLKEKGLLGGHAYTILSVFDRPYKIVKLRNPWGNMEWKGRANDNDEKFWATVSAQEQLNMGFTTQNDGTFFMLWEDFQKYFILIDICELDDNAHYYYLENKFTKEKAICYDLNIEAGNLTVTTSQMNMRELQYANHSKSEDFKYANATIILGKANEKNTEMVYINSKADSSYSDMYMSVDNLQKGRYILCCFLEGPEGETEGTISIYSESNVTMVEAPKVSSVDFLHDVFLDHARKNQSGRQVLSPTPQEWACFDILLDRCGFGYSAFHLDNASTRKLGLQIDQSQYLNSGLELLPPFKGQGVVKLVCQKGKQTIILCRLLSGFYASQLQMPTPKMYRLR